LRSTSWIGGQSVGFCYDSETQQCNFREEEKERETHKCFGAGVLEEGKGTGTRIKDDREKWKGEVDGEMQCNK